MRTLFLLLLAGQAFAHGDDPQTIVQTRTFFGKLSHRLTLQRENPARPVLVPKVSIGKQLSLDIPFSASLYEAIQDYRELHPTPNTLAHVPLSKRAAAQLWELWKGLVSLKNTTPTTFWDFWIGSAHWAGELSQQAAGFTAETFSRLPVLYGIAAGAGYAVYLPIVEVISHGFLLLPPGLECYVVNAAYWGAVALGRDVFAVATDSTDGRPSLAAPGKVCAFLQDQWSRALGQATRHLDTTKTLALDRALYRKELVTTDPMEQRVAESPFWPLGLYGFHQPNSAFLQPRTLTSPWTDFLKQSRKDRIWLAYLQTQSLEFLVQLLDILLWPSYEEGHIQQFADYWSVKRLQGKLKKAIDRFRTHAFVLANHPHADHPNAPAMRALTQRLHALATIHTEIEKLLQQADIWVQTHSPQEVRAGLKEMQERTSLILKHQNAYASGSYCVRNLTEANAGTSEALPR